ncbi:hypothetical protein B0H63DRAFT_559813 [Podospora didyma]|uniref:Uncharacterized protein n=1 Tax=Podospora didyma TaxID=330526 RepID=A0AAE0NP91_9PEZI|nr:hypothetical protein B0H63DRAFT_559813 [Podospora didyma]
MLPEKNSSSLWLESTSMALVCCGTVFVQTPFLRIYESVLCCQSLGRDCPFGGLEDEILCRNNKSVQTQLMDINANLVFWGGVLGPISAVFWVPLWQRLGLQRGLFFARLAAVLGEVVQAAVAYTNGWIPLENIFWASPLASSLLGGGGITFAVLMNTVVAKQTTSSDRSNAILFLNELIPSIFGTLANLVVWRAMDAWQAWTCVLAGLFISLVGVLLLLLGPRRQSDNTTDQRDGIQTTVISGLGALHRIRFAYREVRDQGRVAVLILILSTSFIYNAIGFVTNTLSKQYLPQRFGVNLGDVSLILGGTNFFTLILLVIINVVTKWPIFLIPMHPIIRSLAPMPFSGTQSDAIRWNLCKAAFFLLLGFIGNIILASARSVTTFRAGLLSVNLAIWYTSFTRALLTMLVDAKLLSMVLLLDQALEASGRMVNIEVINRLFWLGMEGDWPLSSPYWGVAVMCLGALGATLYALCSLSGGQSAEAAMASNDGHPTESSPLITRD